MGGRYYASPPPPFFFTVLSVTEEQVQQYLAWVRQKQSSQAGVENSLRRNKEEAPWLAPP